MAKAYIDFLRYCLNDAILLPESTNGIDWMKMMAWAEQQSIVGVIYNGIQKAGKALIIPFDTLMEWIGYVSQIEAQNRLLNNRCVKVVKMFKDAGFDGFVLKGQGNAAMYPHPLWRIPGDIDIFIPQKSQKEIIEFVKEYNPDGRAKYHHIDMGKVDGVEIEVHYRPSFMNNLIYNHRLQKWFQSHTESRGIAVMLEGAGGIPVPTWQFNVVFQL